MSQFKLILPGCWSMQVDVELVKGPKNIYGSAFQKHEKDLTREKEAQRLIDPMKARQWRIRNPNVKHAVTGACIRPTRAHHAS